MKSRTGTGIFFTRYSHTASTLYLSCTGQGGGAGRGGKVEAVGLTTNSRRDGWPA